MSGIVGRTAELRTFADALDAAAHGHGLLLSISGEPGIGKSSLAGEGLRIARDRGFRTLRGTCARFQADVSYAPLLQVLRPLVDPTDPAGRARTADLDGLSHLFTWLDLPAPEPAGNRALERVRLFESVCALLQRAAADHPLAILVDDIHWADPASLDLLAYLTLSLADHDCLIVTTDRGDPIESVRRFRALLRRSDRVVDIRLGPLLPDEVADLVACELGGEPPAPLLELLGRRAHGIPLYVTSLVGRLRAQRRLFRSGGRWVLGPGPDAGLPDDLADVIADRLDELPAAELDILSALGIWADDATSDMIGALLADIDDLPARLDALVTAGLVDEHVGDAISYRPHHPLVGEAAHARLSARERRVLHAAAAHFLLDRPNADDASASRLLAHHVRLAGPAFDPDQALDILLAASREESTDRSGSEVLLLAQATATLIRERGRIDLLPASLERTAEAAALAGDTAAAVSAWREAAAAHGSDNPAASRCLRRLALLQLELGQVDEADRSLDEALARLGDDDAGHERFKVLQFRATFSARRLDLSRLKDCLPALRAAASAIGFAEVADAFERYLNAGIGGLTLHPAATDFPGVSSRLADALDGEADQTLLVPWYRPWIADAISRGDLAQARIRVSRAPRHSSVSPGTYSTAVALGALTEWLAGDWDRALRLTGEALVLAHRHASSRSATLALATRGLILAHRGDLDRAQDCVTDTRAMFPDGDPHTVSTVDTVAAQVALLRGHLDEALTEIDRAGPVSYFGMLTLTLRATTAVAADDQDRLAGLAGDVDLVEGPWAVALARRIHGLRHRDRSVLTDGTARLTELGLVYEAALARLEMAELQPANPDADAEQAHSALAVFDRLGAVPAADRARRLLRRLGYRAPPGPRSNGQLSDRERQVAELVAQGLSNAEVASRLFISHRTVTTHLERIYRRLGIASRGELTSYLRDDSGRTSTGLRTATDTGRGDRRKD